jgi:N-acetylmuramoyl-L-alanine amidase
VSLSDRSLIDMVIFHTNDAPGAAHYAIDRHGQTREITPESTVLDALGAGFWRGRSTLAPHCIAVAVSAPHPVLQLAAVVDLCLDLLSRHPIPPRNFVARNDAAPNAEPLEGFDWEGLARNGIGLWPSGVPDLGTGGTVRDAASLRDVRAALAAIGYRVAPEGALDPALSLVLRAFQHHWRPEAITGQADAGTLARLLAVARLCA